MSGLIVYPNVSMQRLILDTFSISAALVIYTSLIALGIFFIASYWKVFTKAGEHGWAIFVPFYGNYVLYKIAFGNGWLFLLSFVPIVNFITAIVLPFMLAKAFDKGLGWGFGLLFLSFIFYPMLAFGSSRYVGNRYFTY